MMKIVSPLRCSKIVTILTQNITDVDISEIGVEDTIQELKCPRCNLCVAINWRNVWRTLQDVLTDRTKDNGWLHVSSAADRVVHYTMSQILYNTYETPSDNELEVLYDIPDRSDQIKILWLQKAAIGFYTVKLKGTVIENTGEKYTMHMLDTAYIRTTHRRQGHGLSILTDLLQGRVGQDMGLSSPISRSMWRVLNRFLRDFPEWRENLWEMEGAGKEGNRKLIWISLASKNKQQNKGSTN